MLDINFDVKVQGLFKFEVRKANNDLVSETSFIPNLVLDQGLELLGTHSPIDFCKVGSGVTTPQKSDLDLENTIATTSDVPENFRQPISGFNTDEGYVWTRKIFRYNQGQATGNISEVGVGGDGKLFNRSLVKDSTGLFATVTVMEDETLDVTVEIRAYLDQESRTYNVMMSGINYTLRTEPLFEVGVPNHLFGGGGVYQYHPVGYSSGITSRISRPSQSVSGFTGAGATYNTKEYVAGSKEKVFDCYWGLSAGNAAPSRTFVIPTSIGSYQTEFSPTIPKTSDHILKLTFKISWDRYE